MTLREFEVALREAGVVADLGEVRTLFDQFDRNKDGRITFDEFHSMCRGRYVC